MSGILYVCGTPIGNLEDMTPRAVRILNEVDIIAAEDTRNSIKLLNHFEIRTPMVSYHEYNEHERGNELIRKLKDGTNIAIITDAGMPAISDPGETLVRMAREEGLMVVVVPGPSAVVSALALSGLDTRRFVFEGFLPRVKKEHKERIEAIRTEERTIVLYEAPHRLKKSLEELAEVLGAQRKISISRELTKKHEETVLTTLGEAAAYYNENDPKGEFVLVIEGRNKEEAIEEQRKSWESMSLAEHVQYYVNQGNDKKEAMRLTAADRGLSRRDVYNALLEK